MSAYFILLLCATAALAQDYYSSNYDDYGDYNYDSVSDLDAKSGFGYDYYDDYAYPDPVMNRNGRSGHAYRAPAMNHYGRSGHAYRAPAMNRYGRSGHSYKRPSKPHAPVIIKKKKEKKRKIISEMRGSYIPGGTAMFGKFKDLRSCEKACELTPTCFAGDFNPWVGKCYLHSNLTACQSMRTHKAITHFKKVPCSVLETPRGLITLGASSYYGLEQKKIDSLMECIKKCANAGGGVAPMPSTAGTSPQLCFGIDYNFATHKCFFHSNIKICNGIADTNATPLTPVTQRADPSSVNILICPVAPETG